MWSFNICFKGQHIVPYILHLLLDLLMVTFASNVQASGNNAVMT